MDEIVSGGQSRLKKAAPVERALPPPKDARNQMLDMIKGGGFQLRSVQLQKKPAAENKSAMANDVMSILARRAAMEASDDDDDDEDDEDEADGWD